MINKIKKIAGYTLLELLLSIVVGSLAISLSFLVLNWVVRNVYNFESNYMENTKFSLFEQQLAIDLNKYPSIHYSKVQNQLIFSSPIDSVVYLFKDQYILRRNDTFDLQIMENEFFFLGAPRANGTIDAIRITNQVENHEKVLFLSKEVDSKSIIENGS